MGIASLSRPDYEKKNKIEKLLLVGIIVSLEKTAFDI